MGVMERVREMRMRGRGVCEWRKCIEGSVESD